MPDTLAAAEQINTSLNDIAAALTGSMPTDGSAAFTGPVNFNNQPISGIGSLNVAGAITGAYISSPGDINAGNAFTGNDVNVSGTIQTTLGRVKSMNASNNPSFCCYDTGQNVAAGMYLGGSDLLWFGDMDGNGNATTSGWGYFDIATGGFTVLNTITATNGFFTGAGVNAANITASGNVTAQGGIIGNLGANFYGDVVMNAHWLQNCQGNTTSFTVQGTLTTTVDVNAGGWLYGNELVTRDGVGQHSWNFGINGGYGYAQADQGAIFLWGTSDARYKSNVAPVTAGALAMVIATPIFSFDMKLTAADTGRRCDIGFIAQQLPQPLQSVSQGIYGVDTNSCLAAAFLAIRELSERLARVEAHGQ